MKTIGTYLLGLLIILSPLLILVFFMSRENLDFFDILLTSITPGIGITFFVLSILIVAPYYVIGKLKNKAHRITSEK